MSDELVISDGKRKPKIGDVVVFKVLDATESKVAMHLAAVVVKVWSAGVVNLHVYNDGSEADFGILVLGRPVGQGSDFKVRSVRYDENDRLCWSWPRPDLY